MNTLWHGDNLGILRNHIADETVDLIYLDPPFNSNQNYNVLFKEKSGAASPSQMEAFTDTWTWDQAAVAAMDDIAVTAPAKVVRTIEALRDMVGDNDLMAYLAMMCQRLVELHRVLKATGSLYLHCDPAASHYLKVLLDSIFGKDKCTNEIIWHYNTGGKGKKSFLRKHDVIFWYRKSDSYTFNRKAVAIPRTVGTAHLRRGVDENGREFYEDYSPRKSGKLYRWYLDDGLTPMDVWTDIQALNPAARERLGYPTQKPLALLERIVAASSNADDVILDPFCGCGTAVAAAEKLGRQWIGIDITYLAIAVMKQRMNDHFPDAAFRVEGVPSDRGGAEALFHANQYSFQWWAVDALGINARPFGDKKKGSDKGIDGEFFYSNEHGRAVRGIIQVKGGKTGSRDIRDFRGTMEREKIDLGIFVCLQDTTKDMRAEAASAGSVESGFSGRRHPRIQILTIQDLFEGKTPDIPYLQSAHQQAPRITRKAEKARKLPINLDAAMPAADRGD